MTLGKKVRRPNIIRPVKMHISFPEDVLGKMMLKLYSKVEGRVPVGAYSTYVTNLVRQDLEKDQRTKDAD